MEKHPKVSSNAVISIIFAVIIYIIAIVLLDKSTKNKLIEEIFIEGEKAKKIGYADKLASVEVSLEKYRKCQLKIYI